MICHCTHAIGLPPLAYSIAVHRCVLGIPVNRAAWACLRPTAGTRPLSLRDCVQRPRSSPWAPVLCLFSSSRDRPGSVPHQRCFIFPGGWDLLLIILWQEGVIIFKRRLSVGLSFLFFKWALCLIQVFMGVVFSLKHSRTAQGAFFAFSPSSWFICQSGGGPAIALAGDGWTQHIVCLRTTPFELAVIKTWS